MRDYLFDRVLELPWIAAGIGLGVITGYLIAARATAGSAVRRALWLSLGTALALLFGVAEYDADLALGHFIARSEMAVLAAAVTLAAGTVAATIIAAGKGAGWIPRARVSFPYDLFVRACLAAFGLGMAAYLIVYPPTRWVFDTIVTLAFTAGLLFALPAEGSRLLEGVLRLGAAAAIAAALAGVMLGNALLILAGTFTGGAACVVLGAERRAA